MRKFMETNYVKLWKENNINECVMEFNCGGDSMNETNFILYDNERNKVDCHELTDHFEDEVYNEVNFYEASDGHYLGEFGTVTITLNDEEDGFEYYKSSESEFEEEFGDYLKVKLTDEEVKLLTEKIENLNGGGWEERDNINYKVDCILTDNEETILENLIERIKEDVEGSEIKDGRGEEVDGNSRGYDTEDELIIKDNVLQVRFSNYFIFTIESED
jgi:hypothetical protein